MTHLSKFRNNLFKRKKKNKKLEQLEKEEKACEEMKAPGSLNKFSSERDKRAFEDKFRCNIRDFEEEKYMAKKGIKKIE